VARTVTPSIYTFQARSKPNVVTSVRAVRTKGLKRALRLNDQARSNAASRAQRWAKHGITLLLLSALIVAGIAVYYTRQEWREMYMKVMVR
jgi:hypothetical protein